jgi:hypothetical protein
MTSVRETLYISDKYLQFVSVHHRHHHHSSDLHCLAGHTGHHYLAHRTAHRTQSLISNL